MRIAYFVIAAAVGAAAVVPSQASPTPQLAGMKLVAEKSASVSEIAAAQQNGNKNGTNGNQNGNQGYFGGYGGHGGPRGYYALGEYAFLFGDASPTAAGTGNGELGDLDLTGDKDLGMMDPR